MKIGGVKVVEAVDDPHDIHLDSIPTSFEEGTGEAIRPGSFVAMHLVDCVFDFLLREGVGQAIKVRIVEVQLLPIEVMCPLRPFPNGRP